MAYPGLPWKMSQKPGSIRTPAPLFGEHNEHVFLGSPIAKHVIETYYAKLEGQPLPPPEERIEYPVEIVSPGYFETNNTTALRADESRNRDILGRIPAGRWGRPEDLQGATVFLASPAAGYVTGVTLPVDGGWMGR